MTKEDYKNYQKSIEILGFPNQKVLDYNEVIAHYVDAINYYGNFIKDEEMLELEAYYNLNISLYYCTGEVLGEYLLENANYYADYDKAATNKHYMEILTAANIVLNNFYSNNYFEYGDQVFSGFMVVANAIYDYENTNKKVKIYS